jgi:ligand-binding sensor domain-containing protein
MSLHYAVHAQLVSQWQNMSSMYAVNAITSANEIIYAGTKGGIFSYDTKSGSTEYWRVSDSTLLSSTITSIAYDSSMQTIWAGAENGAIVIFDIQNKSWTSITAILTAQPQGIASKRIRTFTFHKGITYCGGDFGIMKFQGFIPGDWIKFIGTIPSGTSIGSLAILQDTLWVGTEKGLAKASINATLQEISSWKVLNSEAINAMITDNNGIIWAEFDALKYRRNGAVETLNIGFQTQLNDVSVHNGIIHYGTPNGIFVYPSNTKISGLPAIQIRGFHHLPDGSIALIQQIGGIGYLSNSTYIPIRPNTPAGSKYGSLSVDNASNLWVNMDEGFVGVLIGSDWKNFNRSDVFGAKALGNTRFNALQSMNNGTMWIGSFGNGFAIGSVEGNDVKFTQMDDEARKNLAINAGDYTVSGKVTEERDGSVWIPRLTTGNDGALIVKKNPDGTYIPYQGSISGKKFTIAEIDNNKTVWLGAPTSNTGDGNVYYFNQKNTPNDETDDIRGPLTALSDIRVIRRDASGFMWFGTGTGLSVMYSPGSVLSGRQPNIISIAGLKGQVVNDIAIDAVNNKWIATDNGLFVLSEDGSEILETYTARNTIFQSTAIKTITIDKQQGLVYIGTDEGLYRGITTIVMPALDYSRIRCFPQPFIPGIHPHVTIEGLGEQSGISIVTPSGMPIRNITTQSGRIIWDGKNDQGEIVGSGVYLIIAQSGNQDQSGIAKCMVIRK